MKNLVASINENRAFAIPDTFEAVCNSKFQQSLSEALTAYRKLMAKVRPRYVTLLTLSRVRTLQWPSPSFTENTSARKTKALPSSWRAL